MLKWTFCFSRNLSINSRQHTHSITPQDSFPLDQSWGHFCLKDMIQKRMQGQFIYLYMLCMLMKHVCCRIRMMVK